MNHQKLFYAFVIAIVAGCSGPGPSNREAGALTGGALGAGLGAIIGHQVGNTGAGIAIGAGAGALSGGLIGNSQDVQENRVETQEEVLRRQEEELRRQRREIEDLRRQEYHDQSFDRYREPDAGYDDRAVDPDRDDSFKY